MFICGGFEIPAGTTSTYLLLSLAVDLVTYWGGTEIVVEAADDTIASNLLSICKLIYEIMQKSSVSVVDK